MSQDRETNLALFIDFDNVALGARDARQRFDIKILLQRILEKGKIIVKRAYADWHHYKEHMSPLHEAAIELIEIPMPRISGKNSADIRLVVDAMDMCYSKHHVDTFVIVSGDSDFSPLVSKLRENNKRVIGVGVKNSSSNLLIGNCDEFIFYDDIYREAVGQMGRGVSHVPADKRELFDFLVKTTQSLLQESRGVLYSSLIKDTMTRKQPDFNERSYGYANFGDLLDDARRLGLLVVERDARAGGTWVVHGLGKGRTGDAKQEKKAEARGEAKAEAKAEVKAEAKAEAAAGEGNGKSGRGRRRRGGRGRGRDREGEGARTAREGAEAAAEPPAAEPAPGLAADPAPAEDPASAREQDAAAAGRSTTKKTTTRKKTTRKAPAKKAAGKKTTTKKKTTKKAPAKKAAKKKTTTKKKTTKKTSARKTTRKKTTARKADEPGS